MVNSRLFCLGVGLCVALVMAVPASGQQSSQRPAEFGAAPFVAGVVMAPRRQREELAPAVQSVAVAAVALNKSADDAANRIAFDESLKRLHLAERDEPAWALGQYKRFFNERALTPALGVQVGLKIAELRSEMGDVAGALQTCEVLKNKYAGEPAVALLSLPMARILSGQKRYLRASECLLQATPELMALGPGDYAATSDLLLQVAQQNLESGEPEGLVRARALYVETEAIYLRWMKRDAVAHLWQRFEELERRYRAAHSDGRADELMPKVEDALLQMPTDAGYVEGAVLSLEMARWLIEHEKPKQARVFYDRIPKFADDWHMGLALYDQALALIDQGKHEPARVLLKQSVSGSKGVELKVGFLSLLSSSYLATKEWELARSTAQTALDLNATLVNPPQDAGFQYQAQRAREVLAAVADAQKTAVEAGAEEAPSL